MVEFKEYGFGKERERDFTVVEAKIEDSKIENPKGGEQRKQIHIIMEDMEHVWKNQHEWYGISEAMGSSFFDLTIRLEKLGIIDGSSIKESKDSKELAKIMASALKDKQIHFKEEKVGRKSGLTWMPKRML